MDAVCRSEECRQIARCRTAETQAAAKLRYDEQHRHVEYQDGELVWLWVLLRKPGLCEKLLCQYVGPYRIVHVCDDEPIAGHLGSRTENR